MAKRPPRVPHTAKAQEVAARQAELARAAKAAAEAAAAEAEAARLADERVRAAEQAEAELAARQAARPRKAASGRARAVPGAARRRRNQEPAKQQRRLLERAALEGAIRDPGEAPRVVERVDRPQATAPTPARSLSTRVIALIVILIVSGFMLFPAVTTYVRQQSELRAAKADIAQQQAVQERLNEELDRWEDPEYVQQQARDRIGLALPGEKQYVVQGEPVKTDVEDQSAVKPGEYRQGLPWADGLWDSVVRSSTP